jgi:RNA polymerase sigma factor (sigma-70 family)
MPDPFDTEPAVHERLLADVLLGNKGAERTLVSLLAPSIRCVAARFTLRDPNLREDLIQDVWEHLWKHNWRVLQLWDRRGPLVHYVVVVASNRIKDRLTTSAERARRQELPLEECCGLREPDDSEQRHDAEELEQLVKCMERAKGRLSETYRELIRLRHDVGLKHHEIAKKLGRTLGYVGGTLARAERYLREELLETCADHLGMFRSIFRSPDKTR